MVKKKGHKQKYNLRYIVISVAGFLLSFLFLAAAFGGFLPSLIRLRNFSKNGREVLGVVVEVKMYIHYAEITCEYTDENGAVYTAKGQSSNLNSSEKKQMWRDYEGKSLAMIITDDGDAYVKFRLDYDTRGQIILFCMFTIFPTVFSTCCAIGLTKHIRRVRTGK